jgi:hypothetical protein
MRFVTDQRFVAPWLPSADHELEGPRTTRDQASARSAELAESSAIRRAFERWRSPIVTQEQKSQAADRLIGPTAEPDVTERSDGWEP